MKKLTIAIVILVLTGIIIGVIANTDKECKHEYRKGQYPPTCTEKGYEFYRCILCNDFYRGNDLDVVDHDYEKEEILPTCMAEGYTVYTCKFCNYTYNDDYTELREHTYENGICSICNMYDGTKFLSYELNEDNESYQIVDSYEGIKKVTIPSHYNGLPVTKINGAFYNCTKLEEIIIPENIIEIAESSFEKCSSLTKVVIEANIDKIENNCFDECSSLVSVHLPDSVNRICSCAFGGCENLRDINLKKVINIEDTAFSSCANLEINEFPNNLQSLEIYAFKGCSSLKSFILPKSLIEIGESPFLSCTSIEYLLFEGSRDELLSIEGYPALITFNGFHYESHKLYYYSEDIPNTGGRYWHYDSNNNPVIW